MGILQHAKSRMDRDRLFTHLSSYLPAPVAAALASQSPSSAIKASTNQVSVMFADIRNFSAYCEARPPEEAAAVLHAFFSTATRVVEAEGGVIEAFQGDAILAVWNGDPVADSSAASATHHAERALRAAINLNAAIQGVLPDPAPAGLEPLALGIGVETGPAMAGSFGLASRRTHMVLGRTVTIASRLVEMTADLAHPILVGEGLAAHVGAAGLESLGTFLLDGMRVPHHVYAYPLASAVSLP
jgi:adenylate cyclase